MRVVARRGPTTIVRNRLGLTMAAAGVDASNVEPGRIALLPARPRRRRRSLRDGAARAHRRRTSAWSSPTPPGAPGARARPTSRSARPAWWSPRTSPAATDPHGNPLAVTLPAVADEIAGAAELAQGKLGRPPVRRGPRPRRPGAAAPASTAPARPGPGRGRRAATCSGTAPARPSCARSADATRTAAPSATPSRRPTSPPRWPGSSVATEACRGPGGARRRRSRHPAAPGHRPAHGRRGLLRPRVGASRTGDRGNPTWWRPVSPVTP